MEHNAIVGAIPWPVAAATAAWFGFMAWKSGKTVVLWAIGGGVLGLVLSTLILGLAQALFIPFYTGETPLFRMKIVLLAIVVVLGAGWLFTGSIHRHLLASGRNQAEELPPPPTPPSPEPPPQTPATPAKP
jgi:hypothetical protein